MNLQDIADFISLVKDPVKFESALNNLKEEQQRLTAVIETVGKASDLDALRKKAEKDIRKREGALESRELELTEREKAVTEALTKREADLVELMGMTERMKLETEQRVLESEKLVQSYVSREKELRQAEESIKTQRAELEKREREVNSKLAQLKQVLG